MKFLLVLVSFLGHLFVQKEIPNTFILVMSLCDIKIILFNTHVYY